MALIQYDIMNNCFTCPDAVANIKGSNKAPNLSGKIQFYQKEDCVLIKATVCGLPSSDTGFFAFHIHEGNSCSGDNFSCSGNHYNPSETAHPHHAGDLPPLMLCKGGAFMTVMTDRFNVKDILGRTVIIHDKPDDFNSQPSGNAGTKIGCGVVCRK